MRNTLLVLFLVIFSASVVNAEMVVRTKNQKTYTIPVQAGDVVSIEFKSSEAASVSTPAPPQQQKARKWVDAKKSSHYLQEKIDKNGIQWVEYDNGKAIFTFKPRSESKQFILIYDASRGVTGKIFADRFEWSTKSGSKGSFLGSFQ